MPSREGSAAHDPSHARWDERIARARHLAAEYSTAADVLTFYTGLAEYQKSLLGKHNRVRSPEPAAGPLVPFLEALDLDAVLAAIPDFLSWLPRVAPAPLVEAAAKMRRLDRAQWRHLAHSYLSCDGRAVPDADQTLVFVLEALLQPFAEQVAMRIATSSISARGAPPPFGHPNAHEPRAGDPAAAAPLSGLGAPPPSSGRGRRLEDSLVAAAAGADPNFEPRGPTRCPICSALPVVGVLREVGQGAKRTLVCALCLTEREYLRVVCPACGEQQFDALPVYTADQFAHVRIEACESCSHYLKTIDLTKDGLAVPLVDYMASVSLDVWARDRGYVRLRPNLLRM